MVELCERLGLEDNIEAIDGNGNKTKIACSPDIKGILGTDHRKYFMDLYRLSPRDLNYEGEDNESCVIRPELIKNFRKSKGNQRVLPKINVNIGTGVKFEKGEHYEEQ
jgi:protein TIF31